MSRGEAITGPYADPYLNNNFGIELVYGTNTVAVFSAISGGAMELSVIDYTLNTQGSSQGIFMPGPCSFEPITLSYGVTDDMTFWDWWTALNSGYRNRVNLSLFAFGPLTETAQTGTVVTAVPPTGDKAGDRTAVEDEKREELIPDDELETRYKEERKAERTDPDDPNEAPTDAQIQADWDALEDEDKKQERKDLATTDEEAEAIYAGDRADAEWDAENTVTSATTFTKSGTTQKRYARWDLDFAWPSKITGFKYNVNSATAFIASVTLIYENIARITDLATGGTALTGYSFSEV